MDVSVIVVVAFVSACGAPQDRSNIATTPDYVQPDRDELRQQLGYDSDGGVDARSEQAVLDQLVHDNPPAPSPPPVRQEVAFEESGPAETPEWDQCIKAFVEKQSPVARAQLKRALLTFHTTCDKVERTVVLQPPRGGTTDYLLSPSISIVGSFGQQPKLWVQVIYVGSSWLFVDRVKFAADDFRWESSALRFARENSYGSVWEAAALPVSLAQTRVAVEKLMSATNSTVRFEGERGHFDLEVTEEVKADLRLMVSALKGAHLWR